MNVWRTYVNTVKKNNLDTSSLTKDLSYWRSVLFANTIIYILPFSIIALIPGIYTCIKIKNWVLLSVDIASFINFLTIALAPLLSIKIRKLLFIVNIYVIGIFFQVFIGLSSPGLLYLEAACMFSIFIFPKKYAFYAAIINTAICIIIGIALYFDWLVWQNQNPSPLLAWIAISSNLIFLNFVSAALLPRLFNGLQETIDNEKSLQEQLVIKQEHLQSTLESLKHKNIDLRAIAWMQSHKVRAPLANVMGITSLLKANHLCDQEKEEMMNYLQTSATQLDDVIKEISSRANKPE
jgi:signal transduction histidine kinase